MEIVISGRERIYRTDGRKSKISGRLMQVEYLDRFGNWKTVKNPSTIYLVQNEMEAA